MNNTNPVRVIAITSGKGGVGKTNLAVNYGMRLPNGPGGGFTGRRYGLGAEWIFYGVCIPNVIFLMCIRP